MKRVPCFLGFFCGVGPFSKIIDLLHGRFVSGAKGPEQLLDELSDFLDGQVVHFDSEGLIVVCRTKPVLGNDGRGVVVAGSLCEYKY